MHCGEETGIGMERSNRRRAQGPSVAAPLGYCTRRDLAITICATLQPIFARNGRLDQCKSLLARRLMMPLRRSPNTQNPAITATHSANLRRAGASGADELTAAE